MHDLVDDPGFTHLPPRERLKSHALRRAEQRLGRRPTERQYERLSSWCKGAKPKSVYPDKRELHSVDHKGETIQVIYDREWNAIVTFLPRTKSEETAMAAAFRRARKY